MHLSENLKYLRKQGGYTQAELAEQLGLKRPVIGAYEEGRAEPRLQTLQMMSAFFGHSIDQLLQVDLSTGQFKADAVGKSLRVLPIAVDSAQQERATLVPVKAAAGYLQGYGDMDFVGSLPHFSMPFPELPADRSYRVFQIEGDSMLPIPSGSYVIGEYVQDWTQIKPNDRYVLLTRDEGVVFKRLKLQDNANTYQLISDNPDFEPYTLPSDQLLELWKAKGMLCFDLDGLQSYASDDMKKVLQAIARIDQRIK